MNIELVPISHLDRMMLHKMFQFYLYDMSRVMKWPFSDKGDFEVDSSIVDAYFSEENHFPYFIKQNDMIVGFSLARRYPDDKDLMDMGQFYIATMHSGNGLGKYAFEKTLQKYPGNWQVRVLEGNTPAYAFWKSTISKLSSSTVNEILDVYHGKRMTYFHFESR